jgi:L-histidine Nalpha-methyltransferase
VASGADALVELGSGTSEKTRLLLDTATFRRYVPFDVSESTLRAAGVALEAEYPGLEIHGVVGDFEHHLDLVPTDGRRLVAFLGGTIGNLKPAERKQFLADVADGLEPGEGFLLGTDLVKDVARLEAAYNDSEGVTAAFNKNILSVINRRLHADFDPDGFEHRAFFDLDNEWIEMRLVSTVDQTVLVADLDLKADFAAGEELRTEISAKFRREGVETELAAAGLRLTHWWTDPAGDFALSLSLA